MHEPHVVDDLAAYLDDELDETARVTVERHLLRCATCRAALADARHSHARLASWALDPMSDAEARRVREAVLAALPDPPRRHWSPRRRWPALVAVAATLAAVAVTWQVGRPWIRLVPASANDALTAFERAGRAAYRSSSASPDFRVTDGDEAGAWAWLAAQGAPASHLPVVRRASDRPRITMTGASIADLAGTRTSVLTYEVDRHPVTLALAAAADVTGAPATGWWSKRVTTRHADGVESLTWTAGGYTYVLSSAAGGPGAASCLICHDSAAFRARLGPPVPSGRP